MSTTVSSAGRGANACPPWPARRTPPIAAGELDSVALLRFETQDAVTLAEDVLEKTRALQAWQASLPARHASANLSGPSVDHDVSMVAAATLSTEASEHLLLALDELAGRLVEEPVLPTRNGSRA